MIAHADIRRVQEWMGHADVQTTMRYLHYAPRDEDASLVARAFAVRPDSAVAAREGARPGRPFGCGARIGGAVESANIASEEMTEASNNPITLTMKGSRAEHGVSLSDFESFIENFLAALRDYDRARRGEPTRKSGHPDRRAEAVTAFRLVEFHTGSAVATIEPELVGGEDDQLPVGDVPLALAALRALVDDLADARPVPAPVVEALGRACGSVGADGSVEIDIADANPTRLVIDRELLERVSSLAETADDDEVRSISGRLHLLDLEPDRLGVRTASGVEWSCRYPEALEERVKSMLDRIVWVEGSGKLTSPLRGAMTIERIEPVEVEQSALFTTVPVDEDELLARQGIDAPQGLAALSDPQWNDETDDAYLAALLSK